MDYVKTHRYELGTYRESNLPQLAPLFNTYSPQAYYDYIIGLFSSHNTAGKQTIIKPKGKATENPTKGKKRPEGTFEITYQTALGNLSHKFKFTRDKKIINENLLSISEKIKCPESLLKELLEKKKFTFDNQENLNKEVSNGKEV